MPCHIMTTNHHHKLSLISPSHTNSVTVDRMQDCHVKCHCCWLRTIYTSLDDHWWMVRVYWGCASQLLEVSLQCPHTESWRQTHLVWGNPIYSTIRMCCHCETQETVYWIKWLMSCVLTMDPQNHPLLSLTLLESINNSPCHPTSNIIAMSIGQVCKDISHQGKI